MHIHWLIYLLDSNVVSMKVIEIFSSTIHAYAWEKTLNRNNLLCFWGWTAINFFDLVTVSTPVSYSTCTYKFCNLRRKTPSRFDFYVLILNYYG